MAPNVHPYPPFRVVTAKPGSSGEDFLGYSTTSKGFEQAASNSHLPMVALQAEATLYKEQSEESNKNTGPTVLSKTKTKGSLLIN